MDDKACKYIDNPLWISGTSFPEQILHRSFIQIFPRTLNKKRDRVINKEFDIIIPELSLRLEYSSYYWHKNKEKNDQLKRDYCSQNNLYYVEIIDAEERIGNISVETKDRHIVYRLNNHGDYNMITKTLSVIIKDLCERFGINDYIRIDYNKALYEAILFSSKYQYRIVKNDNHEIVGREYIEDCKTDYKLISQYQTIQLDKNTRDKLGLDSYYNINSENQLINEQYNNIDDMMFCGNTLEESGLQPKRNIAEMKRHLINMQLALEQKESNLEKIVRADIGEENRILAEKLKEKEKELKQREKQLRYAEGLIEKKKREIGRKEAVAIQIGEEINYREQQLVIREMTLKNREEEVNEKINSINKMKENAIIEIEVKTHLMREEFNRKKQALVAETKYEKEKIREEKKKLTRQMFSVGIRNGTL